ncbi:Gfo/Idh/MocA family protein [Actinoplanes utahensis]|uniref:Oxidoreductase n=1 Tax=Actinoplanes utahensis TaxID=1869 RepID=A0A0A6UIS7_ACTUT|nr:Gfo/Idh/MocA family oxidoreductase [Actinoplanes utahensis]KHD74224.1 oxidoreductase [Actinoplanes utahensis]GIF35597.1 oxidoreductase [Actinoplanes utahensis]
MNAPLRFGIMGCADIARRKMLPALDAEPTAVVTAVASRDLAKAADLTARFGGEPVQGYDRLLDRDDVDAVYVPLPAVLHAEWIDRALNAGKHVLAEKPLTTDATETRDLYALAERRGLVLFENFMFLQHSQHAAVARMLADGVIGELRGFSATFTIPPKPAGDIRYLPAVGGGVLDDVGVYPVRAALHHLPGPLALTGAVLRQDPAHGVVISGSILLHTGTGIPAQLQFGMEHGYRSGYELIGSAGRIVLDRAFTPPPGVQPVVRIQRQDHYEEVTLPADDQFRNVVTLFTGAVAAGDPLNEFAGASIRLADLMDSIKKNADVRLTTGDLTGVLS